MEKRRQHLDMKAAKTREESPRQCHREQYWQDLDGLARGTIGMGFGKDLEHFEIIPF